MRRILTGNQKTHGLHTVYRSRMPSVAHVLLIPNHYHFYSGINEAVLRDMLRQRHERMESSEETVA